MQVLKDCMKNHSANPKGEYAELDAETDILGHQSTSDSDDAIPDDFFGVIDQPQHDDASSPTSNSVIPSSSIHFVWKSPCSCDMLNCVVLAWTNKQTNKANKSWWPRTVEAMCGSAWMVTSLLRPVPKKVTLRIVRLCFMIRRVTRIPKSCKLYALRET